MEMLGMRVEENSFPSNCGGKCLQRDEKLFSTLVFIFKFHVQPNNENGVFLQNKQSLSLPEFIWISVPMNDYLRLGSECQTWIYTSLTCQFLNLKIWRHGYMDTATRGNLLCASRKAPISPFCQEFEFRLFVETHQLAKPYRLSS